jgi:hypothetical protein
MQYSSFEDMTVWKRGMELAERVFTITEILPRKEDYGLTSQVRRSALSVPGNIAEGSGADTLRTSSISITYLVVHWPKQKVISSTGQELDILARLIWTLF